MRRRSRWFTAPVAGSGLHPLRVIHRERSSLLPKVLLAFVTVLGMAALITLVVETSIAREQLADQALELSDERGTTLSRRIEAEGANARQQMATLAQQLQLDVRDESRLERLHLDTLSLTHLSGGRAEVGAIIDLAAGRVVASLPGRSAIADPGPLELDELGRTPESSTRVVPTTDGSHALVHVQAAGRLGGEPALLAVGYPLDDGRARLLRDDLGVADIEVVVDGRVVASTLPGEDPDPLADVSSADSTVRAEDGRLVRYVRIGGERPWDSASVIGVVSDDPLDGLDDALTRTRILTLVLLLAVGGGLAFAAARVLTRPIVELTETASAIAGGDLERRFRIPERDDELGTLAGALESMRLELRTQLRLIHDQAAALQDAARRIVGAQDRERRRAAQDLHDGLQHQLVLLRMQVSAVGDQLERDPAAAAHEVGRLGRSIDDVLGQLRDTGHELFPSILRDRGLGAALHSLAARSASTVEVRVDPDPLPRLDEDLEVGAYFMIAEAVTNALRHAEADQITATVSLDDERLRLRVADDGRGFPVPDHRSGGLLHLRDRATALGGHCRVRSIPGRGTVVTAELALSGSSGGAL